MLSVSPILLNCSVLTWNKLKIHIWKALNKITTKHSRNNKQSLDSQCHWHSQFRTIKQHSMVVPRELPGCKHYMQLESNSWAQIQLAHISVKDILQYTHSVNNKDFKRTALYLNWLIIINLENNAYFQWLRQYRFNGKYGVDCCCSIFIFC